MGRAGVPTPEMVAGALAARFLHPIDNGSGAVGHWLDDVAHLGVDCYPINRIALFQESSWSGNARISVVQAGIHKPHLVLPNTIAVAPCKLCRRDLYR